MSNVITHKAGDTFELVCKVTDPATDASQDITGYSIVCTARKALTTNENLSLTVSITDASHGIFTVSAAASDTETWPIAVTYLADITVTRPDDFVYSTGTFSIKVVENY